MYIDTSHNTCLAIAYAYMCDSCIWHIHHSSPQLGEVKVNMSDTRRVNIAKIIGACLCAGLSHACHACAAPVCIYIIRKYHALLCNTCIYIYINMNRHNHSICRMQHEHMQAQAYYIDMLHTCNSCLAAEHIHEVD